jgi:hypothetical protein
MQMATMEPESTMQGNIKPSSQDTSWPAATLPTAHLAISLLSVVVSGVVVVTVTRLKREMTPVTRNPLNLLLYLPLAYWSLREVL